MLLAETPQLILFSCRNVSKSNQETRPSGGNKPPGEGREGGRLPPTGTGSRCATLRCKDPFALSRASGSLFPLADLEPSPPNPAVFLARDGSSYQGAFTTLQLKKTGFASPLVIIPLPNCRSPACRSHCLMGRGRETPGSPQSQQPCAAQGLSPAPPAHQQTAGQTPIWGDLGSWRVEATETGWSRGFLEPAHTAPSRCLGPNLMQLLPAVPTKPLVFTPETPEPPLLVLTLLASPDGHCFPGVRGH